MVTATGPSTARPDLSAEHLRRAFAHYPTGVVVVGALIHDRPVGMAVSSFVSMSLEPPLVSVSIAKSSTTWPTLSAAPSLGLTVLSEHQEHASRALSARQGDRFAGVHWRADDDGAVFITDGSLHLAVRVEETLPAGDHHLVLLRIAGISADAAARKPLVFHGSGYHRLVR
uniref:Putative oxidoreductase n=1 Tax=Mycolicibacterium brisbanense TaxID=146020 RepID=B8R4H4_9MYCO|nr:putative oxidoreductase [Mycolicibacterium brisbanense]